MTLAREDCTMMKRFVFSSIALAMFTLALCAADLAQAQNLVANAGFEDVKVMDHITAKAGFGFDCEIVKSGDKLVMAKTRAATIPWERKDIEKITKRDTPSGWIFYEIVLPVVDVVDKTQGHASGKSFKFETKKGKGFLHSAPFDVAAGKKYELSGWVKGQGKASLELLWWTKYSEDEIEMCKHHQDIVPAVQGTGKWTRTGKVFTAPEGATRAYVRLVGEGADVWLDDVAVAAK